MAIPPETSYLECQGCGKALHRLTEAEAQKVAENPCHYITYCSECLPAHMQGETIRVDL